MNFTYNYIKRNFVRARILSYTETQKLGCSNTLTLTCPEYLWDNLNSQKNNDLPTGYWLSTSETSKPFSAWKMQSNGLIGNDIVSSSLSSGVRPVIKVSKYNL